MKYVTLLLLIIFLQGCSTLVSSTREDPIPENRSSRTLGGMIEDNSIEFKAKVNLTKGSQTLSRSNVNPTSFNGVVLLTGQVPNEQTQREAEQVVSQIREVRLVKNELVIAGPTSMVIRTNDTYLTGRVKTQLLTESLTKALNIKVVTENGSVYLMGFVTKQEAENVVEVVRNIVGVTRIVKVFEYID